MILSDKLEIQIGMQFHVESKHVKHDPKNAKTKMERFDRDTNKNLDPLYHFIGVVSVEFNFYPNIKNFNLGMTWS